MNSFTRIGIVGTGFIARGISRLIINHHPDLVLTAALTRRDISNISDYPDPSVLTNSVMELVDKSDLIVECSGDVIQATEVVEKAFEAGLPVVTMDSEFQVTTGSYFVDKGFITEAEGDQPGCLAALREECVQMGFKPVVYGNMKGYLNHYPKPEDMEYWSKKQGFSLDQTVSFTDGTKLQIEQTFIANGTGASITKTGMEGPLTDDTEQAAKELGAIANRLGTAIADYTVSIGQAPGVFITATHDEEERWPLENIKMGAGPYYVLMRNYHLCAIEVVKTIRRVLNNGGVLLNNSRQPQISVAAIAKQELVPGLKIKRGIGGYDVRGEAIKIAEAPDHLPIGMMHDVVIKRRVEPGQTLSWDDVELPDSRALEIASNLYQSLKGYWPEWHLLKR